MKRLLFGLFLGATCLLEPTVALAQGASLETRALREDYRRLQSQLADLLEAHNALKSELSKLSTEVRLLRAQAATKDPTTVTRADLEGLAKSIREIDSKRVQDKNLILKEMQALLRSAPTGAKPPAAALHPEKGFDHSVEAGQTISAIIAAYNNKLKSQGVKKRITLKSVLEANPNLNPRTIRIGQSLFIPDPR
ncbi:MAG: LysM domain-containing protein [Verrucomicrobiota bacterium]|nr:LysM domain-containing protein [Verrucomicrobiota bacterium]